MSLRVVPENGESHDRRIRLAIVVHSMIRGGAERQIVELLRGIDQTRFKTSLIALYATPNGYPVDPLTDFIVLLKRNPAHLCALRRSAVLLRATWLLVMTLKRLRPQVVHAYLPMPCALAAIACQLLGIRIFIAGRRNMAGFHRRGKLLLKWADRIPIRLATAIAGNCRAITDEIIAIDHFPAERAATIYNGVDAARFRNTRNPRLRAELGFHDSDFVFGIVANFHTRKRHIDFVRAAAEIAGAEPRARFLMIGQDHGTLGDVRDCIGRQMLEDRCVVMAGSSEPEKYYACMDCYVSTSDVEGLSNSILEAMASGLPVIATRVGGTPEVVSDGNSGYLVPPYSSEEIVERAKLLMHDPSLCAAMGRCGHRLAQGRFSLRAMVEAHEQLYEGLLAQHA